jgi:hypothetical protein
MVTVDRLPSPRKVDLMKIPLWRKRLAVLLGGGVAILAAAGKCLLILRSDMLRLLDVT